MGYLFQEKGRGPAGLHGLLVYKHEHYMPGYQYLSGFVYNLVLKANLDTWLLAYIGAYG